MMVSCGFMMAFSLISGLIRLIYDGLIGSLAGCLMVLRWFYDFLEKKMFRIFDGFQMAL